MQEKNFTKGVEKLINPITVGTLHFLQSFNDRLPKSVQKKMMEKSSKKNNLMGFVVEPYCFFLAYEITNKDFFEKELPDNFELTKSKIFQNEEEKYYLLIGSFSARTSAFLGNRSEIYVIAKDLSTGLTSWVIIDYDTNTISYDSKNGLTKPSADDGIVTTNFNGEVIVDMQRNDGSKKLIFNSNIKNSKSKKLDPKLWIEGNLSVAYGKKLSDDGDVFSLKFDPREMNEALEIELKDLNIIENNWYREHLSSDPTSLVCFPYAQHFASDSPGHFSSLKNEKELVDSINEIDFDKTEVYSAENFEKLIIMMPMILTFIIVILIVLIIVLIN